MRKIDAEDERRYITAVRDMIRHTAAGTKATDALEKAASAHSLTSAEVSLVAGAYNKSRTEHLLSKTADRQGPAGTFDIADAGAVVRKLYAPAKPVLEKAASELPEGDFSMSDFEPLLQKVAAAAVEPMPIPSVIQHRLQDLTKLRHLLQERLEKEASSSYIRFTEAVTELSRKMLRLPSDRLHKVAQLTINGYPDTGVKMLQLMQRMQPLLKVPQLQKTANTAMFPAEQPYLDIVKIHDLATSVARAQNALTTFKDMQKESGDFGVIAGADLTAMALDRLGTGAISADVPASIKEYVTQGRNQEGVSGAQLDVDIGNQVKALERRRNFFDLILNDKHLARYNFPDLVESYNDSVKSVPGAADQPSVLKQLMLQNIESGGIKDIYQVAQESGLQKNLEEIQKLRNADVTREREVADRSKESDKDRKFQASAAAKDRSFKAKTSSMELKVRQSLARNEFNQKADQADADRKFKASEGEAGRTQTADIKSQELAQRQQEAKDSKLEGKLGYDRQKALTMLRAQMDNSRELVINQPFEVEQADKQQRAARDLELLRRPPGADPTTMGENTPTES
jgi:hypothetical protein